MRLTLERQVEEIMYINVANFGGFTDTFFFSNVTGAE